MRHGGLGDPEHGIEVGLERPIERLVGNVEDRLLAALSRGVVDQNVQPAQFLHRLLDHRTTEGLIADVTGQRHCLASGVADQRHDCLCIRLLVRQVTDGDIGAFAGKGDRCGTPDSRVSAGDQRLAPGEPVGAAVALFAMIRRWLHVPRKAGPGLRLLVEGRFRMQSLGIAQRCGRRLRRGVGISSLGKARQHHAGGEGCGRTLDELQRQPRQYRPEL